MMKKIIFWLLFCALLYVNGVCTAELDNTVYENQGFRYSVLDDGTIEIKGYVGEESKIIVPSQIEGRIVSTIGKRAFYKSWFTEIVLPDGLKKIEDESFGCMYRINRISIPEGVEYIGNKAFFGSFDLINVQFPSTLKYIGERAFYSCSIRNDIVISGNDLIIDNEAFSDLFFLKKISLSGDNIYINERVFSYCPQLTNVMLSEGVVSIGDYAFSGCDGLEKINIPSSVISFGNEVFCRCDKLYKLYVSPDNLLLAELDGALYRKKEKELVFYPLPLNETNIVVETIPDAVKIMGRGVFSGASISGIKLPESLEKIDNEAFLESGLETISLPNGVTMIGDLAFKSCSNMRSILLSENLKEIGKEAFCSCVNLRNIEIPDSVISIDETAFSDCPDLVLIVGRDSYARQYCIDTGLYYKYLNDDWLTN